MRPRLPLAVNATLIAVGALVVGAKSASHVAEPPQTIVEGHTSTSTETRIVTRKLHGRIIRLPSGERVVRVPKLVVRTDSKIIRIPAHNLPVTRLQAAVLEATPNQPITFTVYQPVTITAEPVTVTETLPASTVTSTITVSVPLSPTTSDQGGTTLDSLYRPLEREWHRPVRGRARHASLPESHRRHHVHRRHVHR